MKDFDEQLGENLFHKQFEIPKLTVLCNKFPQTVVKVFQIRKNVSIEQPANYLKMVLGLNRIDQGKNCIPFNDASLVFVGLSSYILTCSDFCP